MTATVWGWLVHNGLYQAVVSWLVFVAAGTILFGWARRFLRRLAGDVLHQQQVIADQLDPRTPGGLGDLPEMVEKAAEAGATRGAKQEARPRG